MSGRHQAAPPRHTHPTPLPRRCAVAGIALTTARFGPGLLKTAFMAGTLTAPFAKTVDRVVTNKCAAALCYAALGLRCAVLYYSCGGAGGPP